MSRWKILATTALATMLVSATAVLPVSAREPQILATATPDQVGMSVPRLERITTVFRKEIADGKLPGAVVMVARKGKIVYSDAIGFQDKGAETPMKLELDIPYLFNDQAACLGGSHDAGRGWRHPAHRSNLQVPARLQRHASERGKYWR